MKSLFCPLFLLQAAIAQALTPIHANQRVRISGSTSSSSHSFSYEGHDNTGESFLVLDPFFKGQVHVKSTDRTYELAAKDQQQSVRLSNGVFSVIPHPDSTDTLSFSILQSSTQHLAVGKAAQPMMTCSDFSGLEDCANDAEFCQAKCHYVPCNGTLALIVAKEAPDSHILSLCSVSKLSQSQVVRYDLSLRDHTAIPALVIFILTILSGLLIVFVLVVLHYNCVVIFQNKSPYQQLSCFCFCPETFFPRCINEETLRQRLSQQAEKTQKPSLQTSDGQFAASNYTGNAMLADDFKIDLQSRYYSEEIEESDGERERGKSPDALSEFALDDEITQAIKRNNR